MFELLEAISKMYFCLANACFDVLHAQLPTAQTNFAQILGNIVKVLTFCSGVNQDTFHGPGDVFCLQLQPSLGKIKRHHAAAMIETFV
jgi:hypothetical protein